MRKRALVFLRLGAAYVALSGVFAGALAVGVVLHVDLRAPRRLVASIASNALATQFVGRIVVGDVRELSLGKRTMVRVAHAEVLDPEGHRVIAADGIEARIDVARLVGSLVRGGTPEVALDHVRIENAEVLLDNDAKGDLGIARAFDTPPSSGPEQATPAAPTESVRLSIADAYVHHAWAHGNLVPPNLDADGDDLRAKVFIVDDKLSVELSDGRVTLRAPRGPNQTGDVHITAKGGLGMPLASSRDLVMHWDAVGEAAGIPFTARVGIEQERLIAQVDVEPVAADLVRRAFPVSPLTESASLHVHAEGPLAKGLVITAKGTAGASTFTVDGELGLHEQQPFRVDVTLTHADGASFGGPATDISGDVHAAGVIHGGAPSGTFVVTTKAGRAADQPTPAIAAEGRFDGERIDASWKATEPGLQAEGAVVLRIPEQTLGFDVRVRARDLFGIARAPGLVNGSATAHATGTIDLARTTITSHVTADATSVVRAPISADSAHVEATIAGPLADPVIDITARATQIRLKEANATDKEPLTYPNATARAHLVLSPVPTLTNVEARVEPPQDADTKAREPDASAKERSEARPLVVKAGTIRFDKGDVTVGGASVAGLGGLVEITTHVGDGGAISVRATGTDVDLERVAALTGIRELRNLPNGSRATLDVDLRTTSARSDGHVDIEVASPDGKVGGELHATFDGRHISAHGRVAAGALGVVQLQRATIDLPGGLSPSTVKRATGSADLYGMIDLSQGAALFGGESVESVGGMGIFSARIERGDPHEMPSVFATARTQDLDLVLNDEGKSTHIGGIDGSVHVSYDGATNDTEVAALTWDANGAIASAATAARVPLLSWASGTQIPNRATLAALELNGVVYIPRRDAARLPGIFARPDLRGALSASAEITGTVGRPSVVLVAHADGMAARQRGRDAGGQPQNYAPIDGVLQARWNGDHVIATLQLDEAERDESVRRGKRSADPSRPAKTDRESGHVRGLVVGRLPVGDLLAGKTPSWNASAELVVTDLELTPLPLPMNLRGVLTGRLEVHDLAGTPVVRARAHVADLLLSRARVGRADLDVAARDGSLEGTVSVQQDDGGHGKVSVVSSSLAWRAGSDIAWDVTKTTRLDYALTRVSIGFLRPLVRQLMPEIEGRVDGSGSATVDANSQLFEGGVALTQGRFYLNAIGEEISDATAVVRFERNGSFRIQDARAKIGAGELKASASGRMKGLEFQEASAVIVIPSKDGVPLSSEGATFAQATGEIKLDAAMSPDRQKVLVTVAVPRAKVTLPERGTQNLQSMEPDKTIAIGVRAADGTLVKASEARGAATLAAEDEEPSKPLTMRFTVNLGNEVVLEGRGLRLGLGGRTIVDIAQEVAVTGQISLKSGGTIDVQGRKFVVDRGTVTFVEGDDSADPIVIAAAYWDAPDRTRIWVEFSGPLKTGSLVLRSEPPYSKNEILSILLFGRADPNQARAGDAKASGGGQATAVGTGAAAAGLNKALGELDENFELEQDRTSANRVRTKLGYRLRRTLKVQLAYASGFSQREPDTTYLFLEWQFVPKWSLIGTRGDRGTSILDVLFQHRY